MQTRIPQRITIDGQIHLSFRDLLYNIVLNTLQNVDYQKLNKKVQDVSTKVLSAKHRRRLERQLKRTTGYRKK
jgi:hypothetical protein